MSKIIFTFLMAVILYGCVEQKDTFSPKIIADSVYSRFSDLNADKSFIMDSSVVVELKKIDRENPYYNVFISEFFADTIKQYHFVERNNEKIVSLSEIIQNEKDILLLRDCIYCHDTIIETSNRFSKEFKNINLLRGKVFNSDTTLRELKNTNKYLSQSIYFQNVTRIDSSKIRNLVKLVYLALQMPPEPTLKNYYVQNVFDLTYLDIINSPAQLDDLYNDLRNTQTFKYEFVKYWFDADISFLKSQKKAFERFLDGDNTVIFYDRMSLAVYGLQFNFCKPLTVKLKRFNPQFIDFERISSIFRIDDMSAEKYNFAKICGALFYDEKINSDSTILIIIYDNHQKYELNLTDYQTFKQKKQTKFNSDIINFRNFIKNSQYFNGIIDLNSVVFQEMFVATQTKPFYIRHFYGDFGSFKYYYINYNYLFIKDLETLGLFNTTYNYSDPNMKSSIENGYFYVYDGTLWKFKTDLSEKELLTLPKY